MPNQERAEQLAQRLEAFARGELNRSEMVKLRDELLDLLNKTRLGMEQRETLNQALRELNQAISQS